MSENEYVKLDIESDKLTIATDRIIPILERIPELQLLSPAEMGMFIALVTTMMYGSNAAEFLDIVKDMTTEVNQQTHQKEPQ